MDEMPGYRIVRTLGEGTRGSIRLALTADGARQVAVKIFHPDVPAAAIDREALALSCVSSEHVLALRDVCVLPKAGPALVIDRLRTESLAWLLRSRSRLTLGESVTLMVSSARAVRAVHDAGFAHGAPVASRLLFGPGNRPVLTGLGHVVALDGTAGLDARRDDWRHVAELARTVLGRVELMGREREAERITAALAQLVTGHGHEADHDALEDAVFALAPPAPVTVRRPAPHGKFDATDAVSAVRAAALAAGVARRVAGTARQSDGVAQAVDADVRPVDGAAQRLDGGMRSPTGAVAEFDDSASTAAVATHRSAPARRLAARAGSLAERVLEHGAVALVRDRLGGVLRTRRRPLVVAGAIAAVLVIGAVTLMPQDGTAARGDVAQTSGQAHASAAPRSSASASATRSADAPVSASATGSTNQPTSTRDPVTADDPVAAVAALLVRRQHCLRQARAACIDSVDEATSPQAASDSAERTAGAQGAAPDYAQYAVSLIERIGGSALVALAPPHGAADAKPATALAVKGEAGWRIRMIYSS